ncbi:thioredoxin-disulfide reductase [Patescibacteria group bacterium]|nr:thioredoxin-disulfide reductase [Patescibacteria group bacterium]
MSNTSFEIVIVGGGCAGLTAAIYTSRGFLSTCVVSGSTSGGQLMITTDVENFPGFPKGVKGPELIERMRSQAEKFGAEFMDYDVDYVEKTGEDSFKAVLENGSVLEAKALIIATGASAKWLGLESEERLKGRGVSVCATCDGPFFKDKVTAVVGGGDAAMEEALFLSKFSPKVYVLVRRDKENLRASKIMQDKAFRTRKIEFLFNTEVKEILGEKVVEGLILHDNIKREDTKLDGVKGLFIAIGHKPNTDFLQGFLDLDRKGYVIVHEGTKTSVGGVFVAGDVADYKYRQAVSAAGFGCMAALDAEKYISDLQTQ